jgi:hypothetical protein
VRKSCQANKAGKAQNVVKIVEKSSICSGVISRTALFSIPSLALKRKKFRKRTISNARKLVLGFVNA